MQAPGDDGRGVHRINGGCSSCRHVVTPAGGYAVGCAEASARSIDVSQVSWSVSPSTLIVVVTLLPVVLS